VSGERAGAPVGPLRRQESLGYQVNHLARLLAHALGAQIAPLGVVPGQFAQLLALYEEDDLTQRELVERVRVEQATMANTLQRMQRDGLVRGVADPADRRRTRVQLTQRARDLESDLVTAARAVNATATRGLSQQEVADYLRTTATLIRNLETQTPSGDRQRPRRPGQKRPARRTADPGNRRRETAHHARRSS
jgi:DNA-binding MarR family transcriptional regulator